MSLNRFRLALPVGAFFRLRHFRVVALAVAAVAASLLLAATPAEAQTPIQWSSTAATTDWGTGGNWVGGVAPASDLTTNTAVFDSTSYVNQPNVNSRSIAGLVIGDGATVTSPLNINTGGANLGIGAAGITMNANAGAAGFGSIIGLGASQTWTNNSVNTLSTASVVNFTNGPVTLLLAGSGSGGYYFPSYYYGTAISDNEFNINPPTSIAVTVNMTGSGIVTIGGIMNTSGGLNIQAGTVNNVGANSATNLDGSGPITLGGGSANATLLTEGPYWTKSTVPGDITAAGGSTGTLTIESENQNNTANGPGITYTGNVILNSNLTLANLTPSSTTAANFSGAISGSGNLIVGSANLGAVVLSGASPSFTGNVLVNNGTLMLVGSGSLPAGTNITMNGGAFNYAPTGAGSQTLGALTFASGDSTVQCSNDGTSAALTLTSVARTSGATGNFILSGAGSSSIAIVGQTANSFIDPGIFFGGGTTAATYAYYDAGGFVRAINYGVDPNTASITSSQATVGDPGSAYNVGVANGVNITAQDTTTISTLQLGTGNFTLAPSSTFTVNGILKAGNSAGGTISGGAIQPSLNADLVVRTDMANDSLTISSPILANGTNALVVSGAGILTLSGANTFSGGVFLNGKYSNDNGGGNLEVSADANLGAPTGGITFNGGTLSLVNPYLTLSAARPVMVNAAGGSIGGYYWNGGITTITIASNISGTGPLNVNLGYGYSNVTIFTGNNSALSGGITSGGGATLEFHGANSTGTGPVTFNTYYGGTALTLRGDNSDVFLTSNVNIGGGGSGGDTINVGPVSSGTAQTLTLSQLTSSGGAPITITGSNGYSLAIGTLTGVQNGATLNPTTANVYIGTVVGSGLNYYAGTTLTLSGATSSNTIGSINISDLGLNSPTTAEIAVNSGTWTITGASSYVRPTAVNGGTLVVANTTGSALGSGNVILNGGTLAGSTYGGTIAGLVQAGTGPHTVAPGAALPPGQYGILNLNGGLNTNANTTLLFNPNPADVLGQDIYSTNIYGGDLINLNSSMLNVSGGQIAFVTTPTTPGDYRLIANLGSGSSGATGLSLPSPPPGSDDAYLLSTTVDPGNLDMVVTNIGAFTGFATWVSSGGTTWSNSLNWVDGSSNNGVPGISGRQSDTAAFSGSSSVTTISVNATPSLSALSFSASNYTLTGPGSLTLSSSTGVASVTVSSGTQTIAGPLVLGTSAAMAPAGGTQLVLSGAISGTGALSLTDAGTLVVTGTASSYSGGTYVNTGKLQLGDGVANNGSLPGSIVNNATVVFANPLPQVYGGTISGSGGLTKVGASLLTLSTIQSYSGPTTISGGTLQSAGASISGLGLTHRWSFNNSYADSVGGVTAIGYGNATLGANQVTTTGNGSSHVNYVALGNGSTNILPTTNAPFTVEMWATENQVENWSRLFDFGTTAGGPSNLLWTFTQGTGNPGAIAWNTGNYGAATFTTGTEYNLSLAVTPNGAGSTLNWYQMDTSGNLIASGNFTSPSNISNLIQTNMWLGRSEYGDNDANASYDEVRIFNTALSLSQLTALDKAGPDDNFAGKLPIATPLIIAANAALDLAGLNQQVASLSDYTPRSGGSVVNSATSPAVLTLSATGGSTTFSGTIQDGAGGVSLVMSGSGTQVLAGANTYSGPTLINGGTLKAGAASALSPSSAFTVNSGVLDVTAASQTVSALSIGTAGTLNIYDLYPLTVSGSAGFASGSTLDITMSNVATPSAPDLLMTYGVGQQSGSFSNVYVNGVLNGFPSGDSLQYSSGSLEIVSSAPPSWSWNHGAGGSWTTPAYWSPSGVPSNGTAVFPELGATSNIQITLDGAQSVGALVFSASEGYTLAAGNSGSLTLQSSTGTATVTVSSGSQTILSSVPVQIAGGNLAIALSGSGILNISGNISDDFATSSIARSLTLGGDGSGQLVLSGSNSYGGGTNVNAGTMYVTNSSALPPNSNLSVGAGGTFVFDPNGPAPAVATSSAHAASAIEAVPEPGTLALLLAGLAVGFGVWMRRKRS